MLPDAYAQWDEAKQIAVLTGVARTASVRFGLDLADLTLVQHAFNTTFEVLTTDGHRYALRVLTNSVSDDSALAAQTAWVHAIATETDVQVPRPIPAADGSYLVRVEVSELSSLERVCELRVMLNSWLPGPDIHEMNVDQGFALGQLMATLHDHAQTWTPPPGTCLPVFADPLMGSPDLLTGSSLIRPEQAAVLAACHERAQAAFDRMLSYAQPIALHGDLHGGNLKWHQQRLAVFDFDDAGMSAPALDLAIATFYLRVEPDDDSVERALRAGYASVRALPEILEEDFESLLASRQLLLVNSLWESTTASLRQQAEGYLAITVARLERYLRGERFILDPQHSG